MQIMRKGALTACAVVGSAAVAQVGALARAQQKREKHRTDTREWLLVGRHLPG